MTTDAALFVPRNVTLQFLSSLFLNAFPTGDAPQVSQIAFQLHRVAGEWDYVEITDSSLQGIEADDFSKVWEQNGEPPEDVI